jgi:hypothetical protein
MVDAAPMNRLVTPRRQWRIEVKQVPIASSAERRLGGGRGRGAHDPLVEVCEDPLLLLGASLPQLSPEELELELPESELVLPETEVLVLVPAEALCSARNRPPREALTAAAVTPTPMVTRRTIPIGRRRNASGSLLSSRLMPQL